MILGQNFAPLDFVHLLAASKYYRQRYLCTCQEICTTTTLDTLRKTYSVDLLATVRFNVIEFTLAANLAPNEDIVIRDVAGATRSILQQTADGGHILLSFQHALAVSGIIHVQAFQADYHDDGRIVTSHADSLIDIETLFPGHRHFILFLRADGRDDIQSSYTGDGFPIFLLADYSFRNTLWGKLFSRSREECFKHESDSESEHEED